MRKTTFKLILDLLSSKTRKLNIILKRKKSVVWLVACFVSLSEATNALWMNFGHAVDSLAIFVKEIWIGQKRHKVF